MKDETCDTRLEGVNSTQCAPDKTPQKRLTRRFLGDINDTSTYGKKHLKAYINGHERFFLGTDNMGNRLIYLVRQEYFLVD